MTHGHTSAIHRSALADVLVYSPEDAMSTMRYMAKIVQRGLKDSWIIDQANQVIASAQPRDTAAQIECIRSFLEAHFLFVDNPVGMQRVQTPRVMLENIVARGKAQGACDDAAVLAATLGMANGIPAAFVAIAFGHATGDPSIDDAQPFGHVITQLFNGDAWIDLDVTRPTDLQRMPDVLRTLTLELQ